MLLNEEKEDPDAYALKVAEDPNYVPVAYAKKLAADPHYVNKWLSDPFRRVHGRVHQLRDSD